MARRRNPVRAQIGGYSQYIDPTDFDSDFSDMTTQKNPEKMTKVESNYLKSRSPEGRNSAIEAIRRTRVANAKNKQLKRTM